MTKDEIIDLLEKDNVYTGLAAIANPGMKKYKSEDIEQFAAYIIRIQNEKDKDSGKKKNPWVGSRTTKEMSEIFKRVAAEGLVFDGKHIILLQRGISYDYIAYKNKMLLVYPDTKIDIDMVYKQDEFMVSKDSGKVEYSHHIVDPFDRKDIDIIGGYCVIKNERGEFLTMLSEKEIQKHRKTSKSNVWWGLWYVDMCKKTIIKKATKFHFEDIYEKINEMDNENYDLSNLKPEQAEVKVVSKPEIDNEAMKELFPGGSDVGR